MAFEIVEVKDVRNVKGKDGREHHFLNLSVTVNASIYMDANAIAFAGLYERFKGKKALLSCDWVEREGKMVLQLNPDSFPVDVPPALLIRHSPGRTVVDGLGEVDNETGEIMGGVKDSSSGASPPKSSFPASFGKK